MERCRELAGAIVAPVEAFIAAHSTVSVERAVLRLLGVDGLTPQEVPLPNAILDAVPLRERARGVAFSFGKGLAETGLDPEALGAEIAAGRCDLRNFTATPDDAAQVR